MDKEVKQRIEQLNNGEIPKGYKKTDFGIFPSDWKTRQLDQLLDFKNGINADKDKYHSGIKMISVNDILSDRPIVYDSIQGQVDIDEDTLKEFGVSYGDILFQRSSETYVDAGKSNVYLDCDKTATYSGFVIRGKKKAEYEPYYLNEALRIEQVRKQIIRRAAGSQHINVGQDSLASVTIPFATSQEQSRITEILMKWDRAIELLETYISSLEKKEKVLIKKAIHSIDAENNKQLFECVNYFPSSLLIKHLSHDNNGYPVYGADGVALKINTYSFDCKTVAIIKYGSNAGKVMLLDGKHSVLGTMAEMTAKPGINIDYIYYLLKSFNFNKYIEISTTPNVYFEDYSKEYFPIPTYEKQKRVADYLQSFNKIILLQKEMLDCIKKQRLVLHQYLLNGIVRVH